ncbi:MAG: response regulator transcription factor [Planctomycetota bacterium]|jgi:DNA-binding NarL/FixJ family response regulator
MKIGLEKSQPKDSNRDSNNRDAQQTIDTRVRILVIRGRPAARNKLSKVLDRLTDLVVCYEAEQPAQAMQIIDQSRIDLALVDICVPDKAGVRLMEKIRMRYPEMPVLAVCSGHLPPGRRARRSGTAIVNTAEAQDVDSIADAIRYSQSLLQSGVSGFSVVFRI